MNTILSRLLAFAAALLALFSGGKPGRPVLTVTVSRSDNGTVLTSELVNRSFVSVTADEYFSLEKYSDGEWTEISADVPVNDIAVSVAPFSVYRESIDPGVLPEGRYRLEKRYSAFPRGGSVSAEFEIT